MFLPAVHLLFPLSVREKKGSPIMGSKKSIAYDYLKEQILSGRLKADDPISEVAVSKELEISRTPLREAMRELEQEGLLVSYPDRGCFVTKMTPYDVEEIYDLRSLLEIRALEKSIDRISDEELDRLEQEFREAKESQDWDRMHEADRDLHRLIVTRSGSRRLQQFIDILNTQTERIRRISGRKASRLEKSFREHLAILSAIRARDKEKAAEALAAHIRSVGRDAIEVTMTNGQ